MTAKYIFTLLIVFAAGWACRSVLIMYQPVTPAALHSSIFQAFIPTSLRFPQAPVRGNTVGNPVKGAPQNPEQLGGCDSAPCTSLKGEAVITVDPPQVHAGETVRITWSTKNMMPESCSISAQSRLVSDSAHGNEGTFISGKIQEDTPYVLSCTEASGGLFSTSTVVHVKTN